MLIILVGSVYEIRLVVNELVDFDPNVSTVDGCDIVAVVLRRHPIYLTVWANKTKYKNVNFGKTLLPGTLKNKALKESIAQSCHQY